MTSPFRQKLKINGPVVVTANRVADGAVVYRTADERWTTQIDQADVTESAAVAGEHLAAAIADELGAVGAYVAPVRVDSAGVHPGNLREAIRLGGPTFDLPAITIGA